MEALPAVIMACARVKGTSDSLICCRNVSESRDEVKPHPKKDASMGREREAVEYN